MPKLSGDCSDRDNGNLTITWSQTNNAGQKISYYIVEYTDQNKNDGGWVSYPSSSKMIEETKVVISIDQLPPSADLVFQVTAVTEFEGERFKSDPVTMNAPSECVTVGGRKNYFAFTVFICVFLML